MKDWEIFVKNRSVLTAQNQPFGLAKTLESFWAVRVNRRGKRLAKLAQKLLIFSYGKFGDGAARPAGSIKKMNIKFEMQGEIWLLIKEYECY